MSAATPSPRRSLLPKVVLGLLIVIAAGVLGAVLANAARSTPAVANGNASSCNAVTIAERDLPSVVTIFTRAGDSSGVGSGEVIRADGYIITNNHVIAAAAGGRGSLDVIFSNGKSASATIVGRDPLTDLAVIRVHGLSGLRTISIGDSEQARIGQGVVVLGAPLGLSSTVTSGIISSLGRAVRVPGETQAALLVDAIQTDAAINPGNSGGALVNCDGGLLGIPSAGASVGSSSDGGGGGSIGVGFAIPVNFAMKVADELISTGRVQHAFIGLQSTPLAASASREVQGAHGLLVVAVSAGGPAAAAGVRAGDVITEVGGQQAVSTDQLMAVTLTKRPGDKVDLQFSRDGHRSQTTITLAAMS